MKTILLCGLLGAFVARAAEEQAFAPKPVPLVQALPLPHDQVSFQRGDDEIARYHFDSLLRRPFVYPIVGPAGRSLTRMGHPHDPVTHSHHNSVWISHHDVNGMSFWDDRAKGRIVHRRVEKLEDGETSAGVTAVNAWIDDKENVVMTERRTTRVQLLDGKEWLLVIDIELSAEKTEVTLGKTPFGLLGVRMAKTIGVHDGAGMIRNSEGAVNETEVLWKRARWVDYSGAITPLAVEGLTLMDHPSNPNHPAFFHVRNDGWMGASLTYDEPRRIEPGKPLRLRYGLYVHSELKKKNEIESAWKEFAK